MQRIDTLSASSDGRFLPGDGGTFRGTQFSAAWCNSVQEEIANLLEENGVVLDPENESQLAEMFAPFLAGKFEEITLSDDNTPPNFTTIQKNKIHQQKSNASDRTDVEPAKISVLSALYTSILSPTGLVIKRLSDTVAQFLEKKIILGTASIEQKSSSGTDFLEFDKSVHVQAVNHQTVVAPGKITQTSNGESTTIEGNVVTTGTVDADKVDAEEVDTPSVKFGSAEMKINRQGAVELNAEMDVDKLIATESVEAPLIKGVSIGDGSASSIVHRKLECGDNSTVSTSLKDGEIILCHVNAGISSCTITDARTGTTATLVRSTQNSRVWPVCSFGSQIFTLG